MNIEFEKLSYETLKEISAATSKEIARRENQRKFELLFNVKVAIEAWQKEFPDSTILLHEKFNEDNLICLSDVNLQQLTSVMEKL